LTKLQAEAHGDESRFIEDHAQTAQKLSVVRSYFGIYGNILASANLTRFDNKHIFLIDTHAGAGMHASREHPDGVVPGTPLIACHEAVRLQRRYPGLRVHVRAIDNEPRWIARLRQRVDPFVAADIGADQVDVQLLGGDFAKYLPEVLKEAQELRAPSLWVVDPYGIDLPFEELEQLQRPARGPEVMINLDLLGIWRVNAAARVDEAVRDAMYSGEGIGVQESLRRLFGGNSWQSVIDDRKTFRANAPALTSAYTDLFPRFEFRQAMQMYSTRGQLRSMVHLCHADLGAVRFKGAFEQSQEIGLLAGARLDHANKAHAALRYWEAYHGQTTSVLRLYEEHVSPTTRARFAAFASSQKRTAMVASMKPALPSPGARRRSPT